MIKPEHKLLLIKQIEKLSKQIHLKSPSKMSKTQHQFITKEGENSRTTELVLWISGSGEYTTINIFSWY